MYSNMSMFKQALQEYDELEREFEEVCLLSGATGSRSRRSLRKRRDSMVGTGMKPGIYSRKYDGLSLFDAARNAAKYRRQIYESKITILDFKIYLFSRQVFYMFALVN